MNPSFVYPKRFADLIKSGEVCQSLMLCHQLREHVGDRLMLYRKSETGCMSLIAADGFVCSKINQISIGVNDLADEILVSITINDMPLSKQAIEAFALAEGFRPDQTRLRARHVMGSYLYVNYGNGNHHGHVIHW